MSKHTPGPWTFTIENDDRYIRAGGDSMMCDTPYYPYCPSGDANWHLIAAAPDLLRELTKVADTLAFMLNNWTMNDSWYEKFTQELKEARDAIAKAEGGES